MKEYAVYKGDKLLCLGTIEECARERGIKVESLKYYLAPAYRRKLAKRQRSRNPIIVVELEEEEE